MFMVIFLLYGKKKGKRVEKGFLRKVKDLVYGLEIRVCWCKNLGFQ